ncbi:31828_t:CDS:2 [Gigaspora margarita]|uniref:31828_t:CDS:1 n=1 Tax=Gigaspora margarita TaxID=4874 RepID=A0ABN7V648_GIGMA|nr:31828_t:CDS:2 [Gigaspora margarita]
MFSDYLEIFSEPIYFPTNKKTIQHDELLLVTNELSITFQLKLKRHDSSFWAPIFHKGEDAQLTRNPALWLSPNDSRPHPMCSVNNNWNHHFATSGLELNKWYHIAYTLSEPQKCMEFYVNGKLVGSIEAKDIKFNEFPLKNGHSDKSTDFQGHMSNFRYYNIRLSTDEIFKDYISYHSNKLDQNRIFSEPTNFPTNKKTIQHDELPSVTNELSMTFQLNLERHDSNWIPIFHKGEDAQHTRNPALWLSPNDLKPHPICSVNNNWNHHFSTSGLELNKWYHIAYTLSEPQKRMEFYVDGELVGYTDVKDIIFNEFPLKIGHSDKSTDFQGQMSNFRYYNIRLSADEIFKDYISYHSNELGLKDLISADPAI